MQKRLFGHIFKTIRKEKKLTQKQLAELLGTSSGYISEIESGKKIPGSEMLYSLKQHFALNGDYLLTGTGPMFREEARGGEESSGDRMSVYPVPRTPPVPGTPPDDITFEIRMDKIKKIVEGIEDEAKREAVIEELFVRAEQAKQSADQAKRLNELERIVIRLEKCKCA